jgi:hypothetical protein
MSLTDAGSWSVDDANRAAGFLRPDKSQPLDDASDLGIPLPFPTPPSLSRSSIRTARMGAEASEDRSQGRSSELRSVRPLLLHLVIGWFWECRRLDRSPRRGRIDQVLTFLDQLGVSCTVLVGVEVCPSIIRRLRVPVLWPLAHDATVAEPPRSLPFRTKSPACTANGRGGRGCEVRSISGPPHPCRAS